MAVFEEVEVAVIGVFYEQNKRDAAQEHKQRGGHVQAVAVEVAEGGVMAGEASGGDGC